jgi:hypothetical protein
MAQIIQYGSYQFPEPHPIVSFSDSTVMVSGVFDHARKNINVIGYLTGASLLELHTAKMGMISGFATGYQDLIIGAASGNSNTGTFSGCLPSNIDFADSDLTTLIPYTVTFSSLEDKAAAQTFGLESVKDSWSYKEKDSRVVSATHTVSAKGVKSSGVNDDPLARAFMFVSGRANGFNNVSSLITGDSAFLKSRAENIDRFNFSYGITEEYDFSQSSMPLTDKGITTSDTKISYSKDAGLRVSVGGSVQGSITGAKLDTGVITSEMAKELMMNSVISSMSDIESGVYSLNLREPNSYKLDLDTGSNRINFNFEFIDLDEATQTGVVKHNYTAAVNATKEVGTISVLVNGSLKYNNPFEVVATGDPATGVRWAAVDNEFSGIDPFLIAKRALIDFTENVTGYMADSSTLNAEPIERTVTKKPFESSIEYSFTFDNKFDISSGILDNLSLQITDLKPIQLTSVMQSTEGFLTQLINERTAGSYSISAKSLDDANKLGVMSGIVGSYAPKPSVEKSFTTNTGLNDLSLQQSWVY